MAHCSVMKPAPVDRRMVMVLKPLSFQTAATSVRPSPSKSPESHRIESAHPPSRTCHAVCFLNAVPVEAYIANVTEPASSHAAINSSGGGFCGVQSTIEQLRSPKICTSPFAVATTILP